MLPQATFSDAGTAAVGTVFGGAFSGPDVVQETNLAFLTIDTDCELDDAIAQTAAGANPAQAHAYLVALGNVQNVVAVIFSTQVLPTSVFRNPPHLRFKRGDIVFVRGVQLSGAQEATTFILLFKRGAQGGGARVAGTRGM